jgi:hypothetical protein
MKKILFKNTLVALVSISLLQGCSKEEVIEIFPEYSLDALSNPSSMTQVNEVLTGAYAGFRASNYYGSASGTGAGWSIMPDAMSDNLYESSAETLANSRDMADWLYTTNTGQVSAFYSAPYQVIAAANIVIRDVDKFTTDLNKGEANRIKGQALAIRALAHFDLFRYFAPSYDKTASSSLALAYIKEFVVSTSLKPSRLNNPDYYQNLFADINEAITLLGDIDMEINESGLTTRPYIDLNAAYAIAARIHLYAGNWTDAANAAYNALTAEDGRPLATTQSAFSGMYDETDIGEAIWNVKFESGQSGPTYIMYWPNNGRSYFRPVPAIAVADGTSGLIRADDIRHLAFFTPDARGISITKYQGKAAADGNANFPAIRSGEMLLIHAEALARSGSESLGLASLNALRAARIEDYTNLNLSGQALLDAIADERRAELVAEGHRFFDLKRTTNTINRGYPCGVVAISASGECALTPSDREWTLPIPQSVRNANENMEQTPGWE